MPSDTGLWWAVLTVWGVVNALNLFQAVGFRSRVRSRSMVINHRMGYAIIALAIPAFIALLAFVRAGSGWLNISGPVIFLAFVLLMIDVDYIWKIEFRSPMRYSIAAPYLLLFFGSILLMGLPMYTLNRNLWLITVATTIVLLVAMVNAIREGEG
jgi:hypothetical protein